MAVWFMPQCSRAVGHERFVTPGISVPPKRQQILSRLRDVYFVFLFSDGDVNPESSEYDVLMLLAS